MPSLVVNQGLQRIGVQASSGTNAAEPTFGTGRTIQVMTWDIGGTAFAAANTKLNDSGDVLGTVNTQYFDQAFDLTPSRSSQTVTHISTLGTADGNFVIRRIALHDNTAANVTNSSTSLVCGVDGQSLTKTSDFTLETTLNLLYTSV